MCSLTAFGSRIECHASKNNLFDHWEDLEDLVEKGGES